jgi:hypothetical protein
VFACIKTQPVTEWKPVNKEGSIRIARTMKADFHNLDKKPTFFSVICKTAVTVYTKFFNIQKLDVSTTP